MTTLKILRNWMKDNRAVFFKRYPKPNATKTRRVWDNASRFLNNAFEGDMRGGESGHEDSERTAQAFLEQLQQFLNK